MARNIILNSNHATPRTNAIPATNPIDRPVANPEEKLAVAIITRP
jgi:hypothetical protein